MNNPLLKKRRVFSFENVPVWRQYIYLLLIGFVITAAFIVPAMIYDGGPFTFYGDYNVQEIPFWYEAHAAVKRGDIFWNWTSDLGVNFIGSYAYYMLSSPCELAFLFIELLSRYTALWAFLRRGISLMNVTTY